MLSFSPSNQRPGKVQIRKTLALHQQVMLSWGDQPRKVIPEAALINLKSHSLSQHLSYEVFVPLGRFFCPSRFCKCTYSFIQKLSEILKYFIGSFSLEEQRNKKQMVSVTFSFVSSLCPLLKTLQICRRHALQQWIVQNETKLHLLDFTYSF